MLPKKKRNDPSTPTRKGGIEQPVSSPVKLPDKKKVFTGATAMDEDMSPRTKNPEDEREARKQEREARKERIAKQKETGVKVRATVKSASQKKSAVKEGEDILVEDASEEEETVASERAPEKSRSRSRSRTRFKEGGAEKSQSRSRSRSKEKGKSGSRSRSLSRSHANKRGSSFLSKVRSNSVDSSFTTVQGAGSGSSEEEEAGKSKSSKTAGKPTDKKKTAKFSDNIPDNEGKTASTKKQAKAKKKESYASKATVE